LVKKFRAFYGTRRFIPVFTRARHRSLSWARWIQATSSHIISSGHVLSSHPGWRLARVSSLQASQPKCLPCTACLVVLDFILNKWQSGIEVRTFIP
jgi:hypothetical protein